MASNLGRKGHPQDQTHLDGPLCCACSACCACACLAWHPVGHGYTAAAGWPRWLKKAAPANWKATAPPGEAHRWDSESFEAPKHRSAANMRKLLKMSDVNSWSIHDNSCQFMSIHVSWCQLMSVDVDCQERSNIWMDAPRIIFGLVKKSLISRGLWPPRPLMPSKVDLAVLPGPDPRGAQDKKTLTQKACLPAFKYILIYIYIYISIYMY